MTNQNAQCIPSLSILDAPVSILGSFQDTLGLIQRRITAHQFTFCVAINPEKIYRAHQDPRLREVLEAADIRICDGVGVSLAAMLLYRRRLPRCTGVDLFMSLAGLAAQEGWRVFLLGASPESNHTTGAALKTRLPSLKIVGQQHGYFEDSAAVVKNINESGADLLFVAMGSPRQEFWISEQMPHLKTTFCMGVGGSFDVVSGAAKRAPALFRKTGTEWLYRLLSHPSRIRRQIALPLFVWGVVRSAIGRH
jgi:N-acetylglucosaminyldiphosphoundecaprenol N-acetyl-beta-D-mannosaminyltransferase